MKMNKPEKLDTLMYALMKSARNISLMDFIHNWGISTKEYEEIEKWFKDELNIKL
jgi:hypothetical protein